MGNFPNLGRKIESCPSWQKIGTGGILVVLIPNLDLNFGNSEPKIQYLGKFGPKNSSRPFCLKIGTHGIWRMLILIPTLVFWICNPKSIFGQIWAKKVKVVWFRWKYSILRMLILIPTLVFWISKPKSIFGLTWIEWNCLFLM